MRKPGKVPILVSSVQIRTDCDHLLKNIKQKVASKARFPAYAYEGLSSQLHSFLDIMQ